ncbi:MAG: hypothetical protein J7647_04900 [Cyanobacteria bacterium SBLK]|nr:hypothetical protein [Cyanobacteria bacterium SBLK]
MRRQPKRIHMAALAPYEDRLLACLSFFRFKRKHSVQARHCLSMYLRQGEQRIKNEVGFYARKLDLSTDELMELIYENPEKAETMLKEVFESEENPLLMDEEDNLDNTIPTKDAE